MMEWVPVRHNSGSSVVTCAPWFFKKNETIHFQINNLVLENVHVGWCFSSHSATAATAKRTHHWNAAHCHDCLPISMHLLYIEFITAHSSPQGLNHMNACACISPSLNPPLYLQQASLSVYREPSVQVVWWHLLLPSHIIKMKKYILQKRKERGGVCNKKCIMKDRAPSAHGQLKKFIYKMMGFPECVGPCSVFAVMRLFLCSSAFPKRERTIQGALCKVNHFCICTCVQLLNSITIPCCHDNAIIHCLQRGMRGSTLSIHSCRNAWGRHIDVRVWGQCGSCQCVQ